MPWKQEPEMMTPAASRNAKVLRRTTTDAEKRLWLHLRRAVALEGSHFRRQVALGAYVADFCSHGAKLIIEVDGEQHGEEDAVRYDAKRTGYLETQGFRVLRFTNLQVLREINMVIDTVAHAVERSPGRLTPTPSPSPQGAGEQIDHLLQP
ncbi:MAG: endonuclease domain-containing protein [Bosea sp. (in: a-proteobacteria)]